MFCELKASFLWDKSQGVQQLGHMVTAWLAFKETANLTSQFYSPTNNVWVSLFLHILTSTCGVGGFFSFFFFLAILIHV